MRNRHLSVLRGPVAMCLLMALGVVASASANEIQLAGIRLGQHVMQVMQVYGQPNGIVKGSGGGTVAGSAATSTTGAAGQTGAAGAGAAGPEGEAGAAPSPEGVGPGAEGAQGAGEPGAAGPGGAAATATAGVGGAGSGGGSVGGAPIGPRPFFRSDCPDWAAPVWVPMTADESLYVYRRGAVVLGIVVDRDGYVNAIAIAGLSCDWARTALWDPHRSVKLGDDYRRVIERYGYPDESKSYARTDRAFASMRSLDAVNAAFGGIANATRDLIMHYGEGNNVEFLLRDMKVIRIHIWEQDMRPPAPRNAGGGGAAAPTGGGEGEGAPAGGPEAGAAPAR
jgi:hypothetical protein